MKIVSVVIGCVVCTFGLLGYWLVNENGRLRFMNAVQVNEVRLLQQELDSLRSKRTYEDGVTDTLIRMGQPNFEGNYTEGFNHARRIYEGASYAEGYHNCLTQLGVKAVQQKYEAPTGVDNEVNE